MEEWMERLARALDEPPVTPGELGQVLRLAREVAHGVERRLAPVSTFLAGLHAGRAEAAGEPREEALRRAVEAARALLPEGAGSEGWEGGEAGPADPGRGLRPADSGQGPGPAGAGGPR